MVKEMKMCGLTHICSLSADAFTTVGERLSLSVACNSKVIWAISLDAKRSIKPKRLKLVLYLFLQVKVKCRWHFFFGNGLNHSFPVLIISISSSNWTFRIYSLIESKRHHDWKATYFGTDYAKINIMFLMTRNCHS